MTYSNLGNLAGGNLGWEEKPVSAPIVAPEHRSNRDEQQRKAPSETHQAYNQQQQIIQRNSRPELTDLVEAMNNLRARKSATQPERLAIYIFFSPVERLFGTFLSVFKHIRDFYRKNTIMRLINKSNQSNVLLEISLIK